MTNDERELAVAALRGMADDLERNYQGVRNPDHFLITLGLQRPMDESFDDVGLGRGDVYTEAFEALQPWLDVFPPSQPDGYGDDDWEQLRDALLHTALELEEES